MSGDGLGCQEHRGGESPGQGRPETSRVEYGGGLGVRPAGPPTASALRSILLSGQQMEEFRENTPAPRSMDTTMKGGWPPAPRGWHLSCSQYLFCVVTTTVVFAGAGAGGLLDFFQEKGSRAANSDSSELTTST